VELASPILRCVLDWVLLIQFSENGDQVNAAFTLESLRSNNKLTSMFQAHHQIEKDVRSLSMAWLLLTHSLPAKRQVSERRLGENCNARNRARLGTLVFVLRQFSK
jgi:hypothetical protein